MRRFAMPLPCHIAVVNDAHFNLAVQNARVSRLAGNGNSDLCPGDRLNQRSSNLFRIRKFPPTPSQSAKADPMEIAGGCTPLMAFNRKHVQITHSLRQDSGPYLLLVSGIATIHGERFAMVLGPCSTRVATSWSSIGNQWQLPRSAP